MNIQELTREIRSGSWTNDEITLIIHAAQNARAQLGRRTINRLQPGTSVQFSSRRTGHVYSGTVVETKLKNVIVQTSGGRYRVPASMLEIV